MNSIFINLLFYAYWLSQASHELLWIAQKWSDAFRRFYSTPLYCFSITKYFIWPVVHTLLSASICLWLGIVCMIFLPNGIWRNIGIRIHQSRPFSHVRLEHNHYGVGLKYGSTILLFCHRISPSTRWRLKFPEGDKFEIWSLRKFESIRIYDDEQQGLVERSHCVSWNYANCFRLLSSTVVLRSAGLLIAMMTMSMIGISYCFS